MCNVIAKSLSGLTANVTGSDKYSAWGGIVKSAAPENVTAVSLPGTIFSEPGESGLATCTAVKRSGVLPKRFERCNRMMFPPKDRCTIWRSVAWRRSFGGNALPGSTSCCEADQEPTHPRCPSLPFADAAPTKRATSSVELKANLRKCASGKPPPKYPVVRPHNTRVHRLESQIRNSFASVWECPKFTNPPRTRRTGRL